MKRTTKFPLLPVLIVDDEEQSLRGFEIGLKTSGINNTVACRDSRDVVEILKGQEADAVLLDLTMPHISGEELLPMIARDYPDVPVIIASGAGELETAVNCMRMGAFDYMVKPVAKERLVSGVKRAIEVRELRRENKLLKQHVLSNDLKNPEAFAKFDSVNEKMHALFRYAESIAQSPEPVLITGDTGVGKEVMARCIHVLAGTEGEFVPVNVAGLDENVFSDTLFGHKKGAFTNAIESRNGLIETASGGTLFLDEIGELSGELQVKLLRLLQEREYMPLGSDVVRRTNARIVVATNRDIDDLQESGGFRKDLFYRLRHHHINIPPLRDRMDDMPLLIKACVERASKKLKMKKPGISKELLDLLVQYDFPGNVRELEAMMVDALSNHTSGKLGLDVFRKWIGQHAVEKKSDQLQALKKSDVAKISNNGKTSVIGNGVLPTLKEAQEELISEALKRSDGNQAEAARFLGITRQALNRRLLSRKK